MSSTQNHIMMEIEPRFITLGSANGPTVHRLIPYAKKRMIGPFTFIDYLPATDFAAGEGMDVRPHPHIGLSTLSYLLEGQVLHHDSLGSRQILSPGDVNWMTAGSGISHSERVPEHLRGQPHRLNLLQLWVALPKEHEDCAPSFKHHPRATMPRFQVGEAEITLIAGQAFGHTSPVEVYSKLFFMDVRLKAGQVFEFDPGTDELAFFGIRGLLQMDDKTIPPDDFVVLAADSKLRLVAAEDSVFVVLGGAAFPEPRHMFWNYVSSSKEKIIAANERWMAKDFPQVPGEPDNLYAPEMKVNPTPLS